jgi:hypothetical protein
MITHLVKDAFGLQPGKERCAGNGSLTELGLLL